MSAKPTEPAKTDETRSGGGGLVPTLLVMVLLTIVAAGAGLLAGHYLKRSLPAAAPAPAPAAGAPKEAKTTGPLVLSLPTVVTNLAGQTGTWVRVEAAALMEGPGPYPSVLPAQLAEDMTALLRTLSVAQISGPSGFQHLREDLIERMRARSEGKVTGIAIHTLVIE